MSDWVLVGFYGPSYASKKAKAWMNLSAFLESVQCPWVCFGDFNFTLSQEDMRGGSSRVSSATNLLREFIFDFSAVDLGFSGNKFTWAKGKWGSAAVKRRLDRGIASIAWRLAFPKASISHLGAFCSDHTPLILDTCLKETFAHRPFRFEAAWIRDPRCYSIIDNAWNEDVRGSHFTKLCKKQETTCKALRKWNKEVFGMCQTRINSLIHKISEIQRAEPSDWNGNIEAKLQAELREWLLRSEVLWHQKSRELWLKEGDKNTNFFHLSTIIRRHQNNIEAIRGDDGIWITDNCPIRQHLQEKFKNLFTAEDVNFPNQLEDLISTVISEEENRALCKIPTPEEIKSTLFHMPEL